MIPPTQRELSQEKLCSSSDYQQHLQFELQQTSSMDSKQVQGLTQDGPGPRFQQRTYPLAPGHIPWSSFATLQKRWNGLEKVLS